MARTFDEPVTLYKGKDQRPVHSQKEFDEAIGEGFTEAYQHQAYPKLVYGENGTHRKVHSPEEEAATLAKGFALKHTEHHLDRPRPAVPAAAVAASDVTPSVPAVPCEDPEKEDLRQRVADLEDLVRSLANKDGKKSDGKDKPAPEQK